MTITIGRSGDLINPNPEAVAGQPRAGRGTPRVDARHLNATPSQPPDPSTVVVDVSTFATRLAAANKLSKQP